ncbi:DUF445 domain-containing protein [Clostridium oryzae]|uniref:DUF445 domain-containing protein n=1 Tax=Clostridium oryzae TaxID=1450648 RepID=A0A1V4I6U6_9CLOT|nr:DUF445 domain-containing protein [Clostridium oryzae]OPJ55718.1 hypothetical protein CLORY_43640 [Clostridium oryzae]
MRNKKKADILLAVLIVLFIGVNIIKAFLGDTYLMRMITFVFEAALVGSIADWFAITALYKKPLGFFSWHTAIIPKNREKVIEAVSKMVENELMSKKMIQKKIENIDFSKYIIEYVENDAKKRGYISDLCIKLLDMLDSEKISDHIEKWLKTKAYEIDIYSYINQFTDSIFKSSEADRFINTVLDYVIDLSKKDQVRLNIENFLDDIVEDNVESKGFFSRLALGIAERTNSVNTEEAAEAVQKEIIDLLFRLKNKNDEMRISIEKKVMEAVYESENQSKIAEYIDKFKNDAVDVTNIKRDIESILNSFIVSLRDELTERKNNINSINDKENVTAISVKNSVYDAKATVEWLENQIYINWYNFKTSDEAKSNLNRYIRIFILKIIRSQHNVIGKVVKDTLSTFTDEALNDFVEDKAGEELHWIRINGCIVGAVFGILVFLFTNEIYAPIIKYLFEH